MRSFNCLNYFFDQMKYLLIDFDSLVDKNDDLIQVLLSKIEL